MNSGESGTASNNNDTSSGGGNAAAPSPGKGGKFLELMQKRLKAEQQHQPQPMETDPPAQQPTNQSSVDPNSSQQPPIPPIDAAASQQLTKPKGKDFASMSARGPRVSPTAIPPQPVQPQPVQPVANTAVSGKPKGKDFSVMASRMTPADPGAAQVARAAQMQAEARAAAGLPPLSKPTATTVTTTLPSIPTPRTSSQMPPQQQRHPSHTRPGGYNGGSGPPQQHYPAQQQPPPTAPYPAGGPPDPLRMPAPPLSSIDPRIRPASAPTQSRRPSKTATTSIKTKAPSRPTPAPTMIEGKVSLPAPPASQPYMAPLVGQRIQDLLSSLDPSYTIDPQAQEQVLQLADDFLDKVCKQSLRIAAHRGSNTVDVQDVQLVLAKQWGIVIPGLGPLSLNKAKILPASSSSKTLSSSSSHGSKRKASTMSKSTGVSQPPNQKTNNTGNETAPMSRPCSNYVIDGL